MPELFIFLLFVLFICAGVDDIISVTPVAPLWLDIFIIAISSIILLFYIVAIIQQIVWAIQERRGWF